MMLRASKIFAIGLFIISFGINYTSRSRAALVCLDGDQDISTIVSTSMSYRATFLSLYGDYCVRGNAISRGIQIVQYYPMISGVDSSYNKIVITFTDGSEQEMPLANGLDVANVYFYQKYDDSDPISVPGLCNTDLENWVCDPNKLNWECINNSPKFANKVQFDWGNEPSRPDEIKNKNGYLCVNTSSIPNGQFVFTETDPGKFHMCIEGTWKTKAPDNWNAIKGDGSTCGGITNYDVDGCCPSGEYYVQAREGVPSSQQCYTLSEITRMCLGGESDNWENYATPKTDFIPVRGADYYVTLPSDYFFEPSIPTYICGGAYCVTDNPVNGLVYEGYYNNYLNEAIIGSKYNCVPNGSAVSLGSCRTLRDGSDTCVCMNGSGFSNYYYQFLKGNQTAMEIINNCGAMPDEQKGPCQECFVKNWMGTDNVAYFTWSSSLGCVDTRTNPFITRIIQIGLGIGSGVAVIRIIQGAFMRQTNDPSKIQEGNEIIVSTIMALVVLAGAVLILQIIGVNILGIFSQGDFDAIISVN